MGPLPVPSLVGRGLLSLRGSSRGLLSLLLAHSLGSTPPPPVISGARFIPTNYLFVPTRLQEEIQLKEEAENNLAAFRSVSPV